MTEVLVRYIHFIGIIGLSSALVSEHLLLSKVMTKAQIKRIAIVDGIYGLSAMVTLIAGLLLWFVVGKPANFYTSNGLFHGKITLFLIMAVLSIFPTVFFMKNRKTDAEEIEIPKKIVMIIRIELVALLIMPLMASMMAKGFGSG